LAAKFNEDGLRQNKNMKSHGFKTFAAVLGLCLCLSAGATDINVFAAASLTDTLKQIAADYEKTSGDKVVFNFAASGTLALQIENGAPADIFFSADESKMDRLAAKGLVVTESRRDLLGNSLVIVAAPDSTAIRSPGDLTNSAISRIAIGDVKMVPAGTYAKAYLEQLGLWQAVQPKLIPCENVRAVLAAVESGNVDAGIVYKTDSLISQKVKIVFDVPVSDGPKISYPVALVKGTGQPEAAVKFLSYLESEAAAAKFRDGGFSVLK
jgi:molybdate transport system substrate-binding protein